jgi:hypothetical protein
MLRHRKRIACAGAPCWLKVDAIGFLSLGGSSCLLSGNSTAGCGPCWAPPEALDAAR